MLQAAADMGRRLLWLVGEGSWDRVAWERVGATLGQLRRYTPWGETGANARRCR